MGSTVRIDTWVDIDEIIGEIPTKALESELITRRDRTLIPVAESYDEFCAQLHEAFRTADSTFFQIVLDRAQPVKCVQ